MVDNIFFEKNKKIYNSTTKKQKVCYMYYIDKKTIMTC